MNLCPSSRKTVAADVIVGHVGPVLAKFAIVTVVCPIPNEEIQEAQQRLTG